MYTDKVPVSCYITGCTEPYRNLAVERYLLEHTPVGSVTLYLWQNKNTVVIGRNQNPWTECNMAQLRIWSAVFPEVVPCTTTAAI